MYTVQQQWRIEPKKSRSSHMISSPAKEVVTTAALGEEKAADDLLHAIVDACVSNVAVLDESGSILYASKAWRLFKKRSTSEPDHFEIAAYYFESCKRLTESEFDDDADITLVDDLQRILSGEERESHHEYFCQSLNEGRPFVMHAARLNLPGPTFRVLITHEDLPAPVREIRNSKERLTQLLETTKVMAWEGEVRDQRFTYVSEQAVKMLGYPASDWYRPNFLASHIHPDDRQRVLAGYRKQTRIAEHFDLTFRMISSEGRTVWVQNLVSVTHENGTASRMHGFMIDISERKRAEETLKDMGTRLIVAQEEARKRLARELHDDLNQRMAMLSIELEQLSQSIEKSSGARKRINKLQLQVQEISSDIHRLSYRLHPSKLDHLGLAPAVNSLCQELSQAQGGSLRVHFHQNGFPADLPNDVTLCIFRIAQEALRNCVKHSGADYVQVLLTRTDHAIRLSISDNGCGFDTGSELMEKGLGFISMHERLRLVDGELSVRSQPRSGTRIDVSVPLTRILMNPKSQKKWREYETPPRNPGR